MRGFWVCAALAALMAGSPANAACLAGVEVGGACWFLSAPGTSCTEACDAAGFPYDEATRTYAGSDGTNEHCEMVLGALGICGNVHSIPECSPGNLGCVPSDPCDPGRCLDVTLPDAVFSGQRACACQALAAAAPAPSMSTLGMIAAVLFMALIGGARLRRRA